MLSFMSLDAAREALDTSGGWLLDFGGSFYLVTDDEGIVTDMRGTEYVARCERLQCWDETRLQE